jgi:hypothetical protein
VSEGQETEQKMAELDQWLSAEIRDTIEQRFYAQVTEQARFEHLIRDPTFLREGKTHVGLFPDHSVVHVRDVARQCLAVLDTVHGVLIPPRDSRRLARMRGCAVLLAYFHDIGMADSSTFGRAMHPEFAAQVVYAPELEDVVGAIWQENSGNLAWHLTQLASEGRLRAAPPVVLREMLALSFAHSKRKVPVDALNDPARLRVIAQRTVATDLHELYRGTQPTEEAESWRAPMLANACLARYTDFGADAFAWLTDSDQELEATAQDVIDVLRVLRCADALRQRGTVLRTSGGYEVFIDQRTAKALYSLRLGRDRLFMLEVDDPLSIGEANLAAIELDATCDLRLEFHRGSFSSPAATARAVSGCARTVRDIQADVIGSFTRADASAGLKPAAAMRIFFEEALDNPDFTEMVRQEIARHDPATAARIAVVPVLQDATPVERRRYLAAPPLAWDAAERAACLAHIARAGHPAEQMDAEQAFENVRLITLKEGEVLIEAGAPSAFVYVPLDDGLVVFPLGGYRTVSAAPWLPLGVTGVIRGAERNATVVAERAAHLLAIPRTVYMRFWHFAHTAASLRAAVAEMEVNAGADAAEESQAASG